MTREATALETFGWHCHFNVIQPIRPDKLPRKLKKQSIGTRSSRRKMFGKDAHFIFY